MISKSLRLLFCIVVLTLLVLYSCHKAPTQQPFRITELNNLIVQANKLFERGKIQDAELLYKEALKKSRLIQDDNATAVILISLSRLYTSVDMIEEAKKCIITAVELSEKTHITESLIEEIIFEKARIGFILNEDTESLLKGLINSKTVSIRIKSLNLLARLKIKKEQYYESERLLKESLIINREISKIEEANSLRLLGELYSKRDKKLAEKYLLKALSIDKELAIPEKIAIDMEALGRFYKTNGDKNSARKYFLNALEIWKGLEREKDKIRVIKELENF